MAVWVVLIMANILQGLASPAPLHVTCSTLNYSAISPSSTCSASCTVADLKYVRYYWQPVEFTTTVIAATVVYLTNAHGKTITSATVKNPLLPGETEMRTNAKGTQYMPATVTINPKWKYVIKITYPTQYIDYGTTYRWNGILSQSSTCLTASPFRVATLSSHPLPSVTPAPPGRGTDYILTSETITQPCAQHMYRNLFPNEAPFVRCASLLCWTPAAATVIGAAKSLTTKKNVKPTCCDLRAADIAKILNCAINGRPKCKREVVGGGGGWEISGCSDKECFFGDGRSPIVTVGPTGTTETKVPACVGAATTASQTINH